MKLTLTIETSRICACRRQVGPMPPAGEPCLAVANDNHGEGN